MCSDDAVPKGNAKGIWGVGVKNGYRKRWISMEDEESKFMRWSSDVFSFDDDEGDNLREISFFIMGVERRYGDKSFRRFLSWWWLGLVRFTIGFDFFSDIR